MPRKARMLKSKRNRIKRIISYILIYKVAHNGIPPTVREIVGDPGVENVQVDQALRIVEGFGLLVKGKSYSSRGISFPGEQYIPPENLMEKLDEALDRSNYDTTE